MFRLRLHAKFLVLVLGSLVLFLAALSYGIVYRETRLLEQKEEEKQRILAFAIYSNLKDNMMEGTPRSTVRVMNSLRGKYGLVRLETVRKNGSQAFDIHETRFDMPEISRVFETGKEFSFRENGSPTLHTILYPLKNDQECLRCHRKQGRILGVLLISLSFEDSLRKIAGTTRQFTAFLAGLILIVGGVLYFLVRTFVLQPLAVLHQGAERIGSGELEHRINLSTNDEIQELARSLNQMAGRLQASYEGLENRIKERTAEVEDKARQLYEYSRGLATISRLSIKVFNAEQPLDEMLDRFMWAVTHGLKYDKAQICLVDRKRAWLEIKRDSGIGSLLRVPEQPLSANDPFAALVRSGRELVVQDLSQDAVFSRFQQRGASGKIALHVIPILAGTHEKLCWQQKKCSKHDCPAYGHDDQKCWLVPETQCGNALIKSYGDKLAYCMTCDVFPVLGILIVAVSSGRLFRRRDLSVLRILVSEMGAALENHRLYDHNRLLVKELLELHRVTAASLIDPSLEKALTAFTDSALKFTGLDACNFWLLSPDAPQLKHCAGGCIGPENENICPPEVPADRGILSRALIGNEIVTEYKMSENDGTELGRSAAQHGYQAMLALPLKTEQRPLGVFTVHKKAATPFLETEIAAFMLLANHATMAINVCVLNEELRGQNRELSANMNLTTGILGNISSGVMLLDREGVVKLINQAGASVLHADPEDMMHQPVTNLFPDAAVFLTSPVGPYQETAVMRPDGTSVDLGFSIAHYQGASGKREGTIVTFRDLTEIKELQSAVLSKERFAAMGQIVAGVAHEIRNPLFGISSIGQIFERELNKPAHLDLVRALLSETTRLNQLVEELLIYGRPIKLALARCDLIGMWKEVIALHREELEQKKITIQGDLEKHLTAYLDANQIRQVFLNLLRNAIDAMPSGGHISIKLLMEDRFIIFKLTDAGNGIPPEQMGKVFDLFYTTKPKGTGLGLAICKKIVEDHGGIIQIESRQWDWLEEAKGTTVTLKLPYKGTPSSIK